MRDQMHPIATDLDCNASSSEEDVVEQPKGVLDFDDTALSCDFMQKFGLDLSESGNTEVIFQREEDNESTTDTVASFDENEVLEAMMLPTVDNMPISQIEIRIKSESDDDIEELSLDESMSFLDYDEIESPNETASDYRNHLCKSESSRKGTKEEKECTSETDTMEYLEKELMEAMMFSTDEKIDVCAPKNEKVTKEDTEADFEREILEAMTLPSDRDESTSTSSVAPEGGNVNDSLDYFEQEIIEAMDSPITMDKEEERGKVLGVELKLGPILYRLPQLNGIRAGIKNLAVTNRYRDQ